MNLNYTIGVGAHKIPCCGCDEIYIEEIGRDSTVGDHKWAAAHGKQKTQYFNTLKKKSLSIREFQLVFSTRI